MPAITLARLRQQAALLAESFNQPAAFVRSLHHLLEFYADRTQRSGQAGERPSLLDAYRVPPPVLRQILLELSPQAQSAPAQALLLCDALWAEPVLEFRLLAAMLLGAIPADRPQPVIKRVEAWSRRDTEEGLVNALLVEGLTRVRREAPQKAISQVELWLAAEEAPIQQLGLRALVPIIRDQNDHNIPIFLRILGPFVRQIPNRLRADLLDVLRVLAHRSPQETAFFLRQILDIHGSPDTAWLIRQCVADFPAEIQPSLRAAGRESHLKKS